MGEGARSRKVVPGAISKAAPIILVALAACAGDPGALPPRHPVQPGAVQVLQPEGLPDPLERLNRGVYAFNRQFDRYVFLPVVDAYELVVPDPVEHGISHFFGNLGELRNGLNGALQGRGEVAGTAIARFMVNSTVGLLGIFDVATEFGIAEHREDLGQTLGRWGLEPGPYLVLPVLGPSSLRDTGGYLGDIAMGLTLPVVSDVNRHVFVNPGVYGLQAVDERHLREFRYLQSGNPFEYDLVRYLYTRQRELDVRK